MKARDVREKSDDELEVLAQELRRERATLSMQLKMGQLKETAKLGQIRKDLARILTVSAQRKAKS